MSVVETVARKLGGAAVLGQEVRSQADLASVVQGRLPLATLKRGPARCRSDASGCPRRRDDPWHGRLGYRRLMDLWRLAGAAHARAFDTGYDRRLASEKACA